MKMYRLSSRIFNDIKDPAAAEGQERINALFVPCPPMLQNNQTGGIPDGSC